MAKQGKKAKIKVKKKVSVQRKDSTDKHKTDSVAYQKAPTKVPSNGVVFRVKMKKKGG